MSQEEQSEAKAKKHAQVLVKRAEGTLTVTNSPKDAHRYLQEAHYLDPDNVAITNALEKLQLKDTEHPLLTLCKSFQASQQEKAGKQALNYLRTAENIPEKIVTKCMNILLRPECAKYQGIRDGIMSGLLNKSIFARIVLAKRLQEKSTTGVFDELYKIGDGVTAGMSLTVMTQEAWPNEQERTSYEADVFRLYLVKLIEPGSIDDPTVDKIRPLREIARLLATDGAQLQCLVDQPIFEAILCRLDIRKLHELTGPATSAIAAFLDAADMRGQDMLVSSVAYYYSKQTDDDLIVAFSAAAAVFPFAQVISAKMFLNPEFLPAMMPLLEKKVRSRYVQIAALKMLSAASSESNCSEAIKKHCLGWVRDAANSDSEIVCATAILVLAKVTGREGDKDGSTRDVEAAAETYSTVEKLKKLLLEDKQAIRDTVFEALGYQSIRKSVKDKLLNDSWLRKFLLLLSQADKDSLRVYSGLTILDNLTTYPPTLSEEQKRIAQLKAYANAATSSSKPSTIEEDWKVDRRCEILVESGLIPVLVELQKKSSTTCLGIISNILLSVGRVQRRLFRNTIIQQGGLKILSEMRYRFDSKQKLPKGGQRTAAHALARLLIAGDPSVLFGPSGNGLMQAITLSLVELLVKDNEAATLSDGTIDLLPTFEACLALTNISAISTNNAAVLIVEKASLQIDGLIFDGKKAIRRAACQLMCNLVQHSAGVALYTDGSDQAQRRLLTLLAVAGSEDLETRLAAGGALASLTEFEGIVGGIRRLQPGSRLLVAMLDDDEEEMRHRGVVCVLNVAAGSGGVGRDARLALGKEGVVAKLRKGRAEVASTEVVRLFDQALKLEFK